MLDIYKLQIFTLVVQEGSFSGAAERLLMTQSGVSQHIQDLEHQLGTRLFERGRRGVRLTNAGEKLLEYAGRILGLVAEAITAVTDVDNLASGQLSIGATPGISVYLMPDWLQGFRARYPTLTISLQTDITANIVAHIRGHRLDLGFIEGELDEVNEARLGVVPLQDVNQRVVIGPGHPWWGREAISIQELDGQPFIMRQAHSQTRRWLEQMLGQYNIQPRVSAEFDNLESIKRSIIAGTCLTLLPEYTVRQEQEMGMIRIIPITDAAMIRTLKLIWDPNRPPSPLMVAFIRQMQAIFPDLPFPLSKSSPL